MLGRRTGREQRGSSSVSLIVCLYNFAESVESLYDGVAKAMEGMGEFFELVFVDDGSTDATYERLEAIARKDGHVRVVRMRSTFGEAAALDAGLRYSKGQRIVYLSGRVRVNPAEIPKFLKALDDGMDLVVGWRFPRRDSCLNRGISWVFNRLTRRLSKVKLHDINSGVVATYRGVLEKISFYGDLYNFIPILAAQQPE